MKKLGFTLAETLITLTIVGVVAALTLPNLVNSHQKQTWGNSLSVAISDFENTMSALIIKDNASNIYGTEVFQSLSGNELSSSSSAELVTDFYGKLSENFPAIKFEADFADLYSEANFKNVHYKAYDFVENDLETGYTGLMNKKGIIYGILISKKDDAYTNAKNEAEVLDLGGNLAMPCGMVMIDVNGDKKPNAIARDMFFFLLGPEGKLYPFGGVDESVYSSDDATNNWEAGSCSDDSLADADTTQGGVYCTGRLIDESFKMDY